MSNEELILLLELFGTYTDIHYMNNELNDAVLLINEHIVEEINNRNSYE